MKNSFFKKIYNFYFKDCCWPYSTSFLLILLIYWIDFFVLGKVRYWPSLSSFFVVVLYYLYNLHLYHKQKFVAVDAVFFIKFLSVKIVILGIILLILFFIS